MNEKQIISAAMKLLNKKSLDAQKNKYGKDYAKEMARRAKLPRKKRYKGLTGID